MAFTCLLYTSQNLRPVSKLERILFPVVVTIVVCTLPPTTAPLVGMLMLGNLFRESGVVRQLQETASNALMYIVVILLGTSVGASTSAESFLNMSTIKIVIPVSYTHLFIGERKGCSQLRYGTVFEGLTESKLWI